MSLCPWNKRWNPTPLIAVALVAALLGFSGCGLMPRPNPPPTASQGIGLKKTVPVTVQLKRERAKRIAAEAKVKELRRLLRNAKARRTATATPKKSGGGDTFNFSGQSMAFFNFGGTPSFPVIPP